VYGPSNKEDLFAFLNYKFASYQYPLDIQVHITKQSSIMLDYDQNCILYDEHKKVKEVKKEIEVESI
jgi:hypothetical protein